jgi:hypothetical protein
VLHTIKLDEGELFGQFCAYSSLVRLGPRRGVFLSTVPMVETGQGVIRVWREWLIQRAKSLQEMESELGMTEALEEPNELSRSFTTNAPLVGKDPCILWTDYKRNVGIKVAVKSKDGKCYKDTLDLDDVPLSFTIEIQGGYMPPFKNLPT